MERSAIRRRSHLLNAVPERVDANALEATHCLTKRFRKLPSAMAPSVLAYNLTRAMNTVGIKPLIAAIAA